MNIKSRKEVVLSYSIFFSLLLLFAVVVYSAPIIDSVTSPANNTEYMGDITIQFTTNQSANVTLGIYNATNGLIISQDHNKSNKTYIHIWNTTNGTFPDGSYNIIVHVQNDINVTYGDATNYTTFLVNITIDNTNSSLTSSNVTLTGPTEAYVRWSTFDDYTNSSVSWDNDFAATFSSRNGNATMVRGGNQVYLSGLNSSTVYYYNYTSCDHAGNCNTSSQTYNFTTPSWISVINWPLNNTVPVNTTMKDGIMTNAANITINFTTGIAANMTVRIHYANSSTVIATLWNNSYTFGPTGNLTHIFTWNTTNGSFPDGLYNLTITGHNATNESQHIKILNNGSIVHSINLTSYHPNPDNIATSASDTAVTITWTTTGAISNSSVNYSSSSILESSQLAVSDTKTKSHTTTISGLASDTKYYFNITNYDVFGNSGKSDLYNFTTLEEPSSGDSSSGSSSGTTTEEDNVVDEGAVTGTVSVGGSSYSFSLGGNDHTVKAVEVDWADQTATLEFSSEIVIVEGGIGHVEPITLDGDKMIVTIDDIPSPTKVKFTLEPVTVSVETPSPTVEETQPTAPSPTGRVPAEAPGRAEGVGTWVFWVVFALIVVVVILFIAFKKKKK